MDKIEFELAEFVSFMGRMGWEFRVERLGRWLVVRSGSGREVCAVRQDEQGVWVERAGQYGSYADAETGGWQWCVQVWVEEMIFGG